jgi:hypothetical protein
VTDVSAWQRGGWGGWREILVSQSDLAAAQELLNSSGD